MRRKLLILLYAWMHRFRNFVDGFITFCKVCLFSIYVRGALHLHHQSHVASSPPANRSPSDSVLRFGFSRSLRA